MLEKILENGPNVIEDLKEYKGLENDIFEIREHVWGNPDKLNILIESFKILNEKSINILKKNKNEDGETMLELYENLEEHPDEKMEKHRQEFIQSSKKTLTLMNLFKIEDKPTPKPVITLELLLFRIEKLEEEVKELKGRISCENIITTEASS